MNNQREETVCREAITQQGSTAILYIPSSTQQSTHSPPSFPTANLSTFGMLTKWKYGHPERDKQRRELHTEACVALSVPLRTQAKGNLSYCSAYNVICLSSTLCLTPAREDMCIDDAHSISNTSLLPPPPSRPITHTLTTPPPTSVER